MPRPLPSTGAGNGKLSWASITEMPMRGALDSCLLIVEVFVFSQDLIHHRTEGEVQSNSQGPEFSRVFHT